MDTNRPPYDENDLASMSQTELDELGRTAAMLARGYGDMLKELETTIREEAGATYDILIKNESTCISAIRTPSCGRGLRWAAFQILSAKSTRTPAWAELCKEVAEDVQQAPNLRLLAVRSLLACYERSADAWIPRVFAEILHEDTAGDRLKYSCYDCILEILGVPFSERVRFEGFLFPDSVDWAKVASFL